MPVAVPQLSSTGFSSDLTNVCENTFMRHPMHTYLRWTDRSHNLARAQVQREEFCIYANGANK